MSFVAESERTVRAGVEAVFDRLADLASWSRWMPSSFRPASSGPSPLRRGARLRVRIAGAPVASTLKVSRSERPRELAWTGGARGVLWAEHVFVFEPLEGGRTRVRSVETWRGALAPVLRPIVQPLATRIGRAQLDGLARSLEGE